MSIETITTVLLAAQAVGGAGAYDLVDLATAKDELSVTDTVNDAFLQRGIAQVSAGVGRYCKRVFQTETLRADIYPERDAYPYQVPGGVQPLQLPRWPVVPDLVALATTADAASGTTLHFASAAGLAVGAPAHVPTLPNVLDYDAYLSGFTIYGAITASALSAGGAGAGYAVGDTGTITTGSADAAYVVDTITGSSGTGPVGTYTLTGAGTLYPAAIANATATGGAQPGAGSGLKIDVTAVSTADVVATLSAAVMADLPSRTIVNFGPRVCLENYPGSWTDLTLGKDYRVDAERGWLIRLSPFTGYPMAWDAVRTVARFQAGYATIPDDLVDVALRAITSRWREKGRDPYLKSRTSPQLGDQTFWVGSLPGQGGLFSAEMTDILDLYRVPTVA